MVQNVGKLGSESEKEGILNLKSVAYSEPFIYFAVLLL